MRALVWLAVAACAGVPPAPEPAPVTPIVPAATAFPPFEPVRALPPFVVNLSATECVVVWSAETDYLAVFVFSSADGGKTFQPQTELGGTAVAVASVGHRVFVLHELSGGGVLPDVVASDDLGATWSGYGAVETVIRPNKTTDLNQLDQMAFRDEQTGRARWNESRWLVTSDGGASWALAAEAPTWEPAPVQDGPCRQRAGTLERRTATSWEPVPGAP